MYLLHRKKIDIYANISLFLSYSEVTAVTRSDGGSAPRDDLYSLERQLRPGARFNKEVQPTRSLNLNSELTYSEMGNSEFSVTEQLNCVSLLNSK